METVGYLEPETAEACHETYRSLGVAAQELVHEMAVAMEFDREEYDARVDSSVVKHTRDTLFGVLLRVSTGSEAAFTSVRDAPEYDAYGLHKEGSDNVDNVAWHISPATETIVAATYQHQPDAAVATLRRIAWNRLYIELLENDSTPASASHQEEG